MPGSKTAALLAAVCAATAFAQEVVKCGAGSYASYTPWHKARTVDGSRKGDQSRWMQNRPLYTTGRRKGDSLPTNDWWTNALVSRWTGNLWSYPAKVRIDAAGVRIAFPSYWIDDGTEMKERSALVLGAAGDFSPEAAEIDDWHDWDVEIVLRDGAKSIRTTLVHGSPFTWIEFEGVEPAVSAEGEMSKPVERTGSYIAKVGDDLYGVWMFRRGKDAVAAAVGLLPDMSAFDALSPYASAIVRSTRVDWRYDEKTAVLETAWNVETEDLSGRTANPVALQGFQPHHLKRTRPAFKCIPGLEWRTPRGLQRAAAGNSLKISYTFAGMLPYWAVPPARRGGTGAHVPGEYSEDMFRGLLADYAERGGFGGDTYWGGKGLLQMALAMMAARELGDAALFAKTRRRLREKFEDWLTWTPGEENFYFSYVPRWGGLVGENTSYDSETFNDHHFHYGYFAYAGALLCMADADFREKFGPMLSLIVRDYANWDRAEKRFPLFRTFDPWAGHSFAGGLGDGNGNGQESSSEAMQGWGGMYLLGLALGDAGMRDAAIFGYVSEARATAEYWFDRDRENIDYTKYRHPYNSNLTCHGVGWWTYFSGDPVWMHSIQWLPNTPALDYLSEDIDFARRDWQTMWQTKEVGGWFEKGRDRNGNPTDCVGDASLGNVLLSYLQRHDPHEAARIFDSLAEKKMGVWANADTGHLTYWATHSHIAWGELDFTVRADYPCARAFVKDGRRTFMAYNAGPKPRKVAFFDGEGVQVGELTAKPHALTVSGERSRALAPFEDWTPGPAKKVSPPKPQEELRVTSLVLSPVRAEAIAGEPVKMRLDVTDQFGGRMSAKGGSVDVDGPQGWRFKHGAFTAAKPGEYRVRVSVGGKEATSVISAKNLEDVNLARLAKVTASGEENPGLSAANAADGDGATRWSSAHRDGEWIAFDFGRALPVGSVKIVWERAHAAHYRVEVSDDGVKWRTVADVPESKGGEETLSWKPVKARHVRILALTRNTQYGVSIFETDIASH